MPSAKCSPELQLDIRLENMRYKRKHSLQFNFFVCLFVACYLVKEEKSIEDNMH